MWLYFGNILFCAFCAWFNCKPGYSPFKSGPVKCTFPPFCNQTELHSCYKPLWIRGRKRPMKPSHGFSFTLINCREKQECNTKINPDTVDVVGGSFWKHISNVFVCCSIINQISWYFLYTGCMSETSSPFSLRHFTGEVSFCWAHIRGQHLHCHLLHSRPGVGPECPAHPLPAHLPNRALCHPRPPGPQLPVQPQQQRQQLWRGGWRTQLGPPQPRTRAHVRPSPADEMHRCHASHQSPGGGGGEGGAGHSRQQASLPLQALPQRVHQPRGTEDAHPLTHPALRVHHLRKGFLQAMAAARPHPHTHR